MSTAYKLEIPHSQLFVGERNARRTGRELAVFKQELSVLARSIEEVHKRTGQGLLQNLVVVKVEEERYEVIAGGRRHAAVGILVTSGIFPDNYPCPCLVVGANDATFASLTENVQRVSMHMADEFDAMLAMVEQGWTIDAIADQFGMTPLNVERRMKLRSAAPELIEAFRNNQITVEQLTSLCSTEDHVLQVEVWERVKHSQYDSSPANLRRLVTSTEVNATTDLRVEFIGGVDAYVAAGGPIRRDLFSQDGEGVFLEDSTLLDRLVHEKLQDMAELVSQEGWGWVEVWEKFDFTSMDRLGHLPRVPVKLSDEDQALLISLCDELFQVEQKSSEADFEDEELQERTFELQEKIEELECKKQQYPTEQRERAGAVVYYQAGEAQIRRGLVKAADRAVINSMLESGEKIQGGRETESAGRKAETVSDALRRSLLGYRNLAVQKLVKDNIKVSKVLLACKAVVSLQHTEMAYQYASTVPMDISISNGYGTRTSCEVSDTGGQAAVEAFKHSKKEFTDKLAKDPLKLWDQLMKLDEKELDGIIAYYVAMSVSVDSEMNGLSDKLGQSLGLSMVEHFTATSENYFGRVSKELIIKALDEKSKVKNEEDRAYLLSLKKATLAKTAEERMAGENWLPELIRPTQSTKGKQRKKA